MRELITKLEETGNLNQTEWIALINGRTPKLAEFLFERARAVRHQYYGHDVYIRGLIEFTNYCRNDCYYCGIRCSNASVARYRLTEDEILDCCQTGYRLGFRTFVLQGGEDAWFTDKRMAVLIRAIKTRFPDCALTLSIGEKSRESYKLFHDMGADRYLLRHETYNANHYRMLHPASSSAIR